MSNFEKIYIPILIIQTLISLVAVMVALSAISSWKSQVNYSNLMSLQSRLRRLIRECRQTLTEVRDKQFYSYLHADLAALYKVKNEDLTLFWALYSPVVILNERAKYFDELEAVASEVLALYDVDIVENVRHLIEMINTIKSASIKATNIRFSNAFESHDNTEELSIYMEIIFSKELNDDFELKIQQYFSEIEEKMSEISMK